jgi:hypothetical protein
LNRFGYEAAHWAHEPKWVPYELVGEEWLRLPCAEVRAAA